MKHQANILIALLFAGALLLTGCAKEKPLTPAPVPQDTVEQGILKGGDNDQSNKENQSGGITDPGDDDDDESGNAVLGRE